MDLQKLSQDLEKVQSAVYLGQTEAAKTMILAIMYEVKAAQQNMHWTGLTPLARKEVEEIVMRALATGSVEIAPPVMYAVSLHLAKGES